MKKKLFCICMIALLCSCGSKKPKEEVNYEQNGAVEFLKSQMKSPSSFQVIDISVDTLDSTVSVDTLYHIAKVFKDYFSIDKVLVDEIKIRKKTFGAHREYRIEYDAANSFGAILRDHEYVYACEDKFYYPLDFYGECFTEEVGEPLPYNKKIKVAGFPTFEEAGCWVDWVELFDPLDKLHN